MKTSHFLRPATTRLIIQRLQRGESINLFGPPGIGKTRLLEDIRDAELADARVAMVSFRGYQNSYAAFCKVICSSAGIQGAAPTTVSGAIQQLREAQKQILLLIDDSQYIAENPKLDPKFDQQFLDALNAVRNTPGVSLLAASIESLHRLTIFINGNPVTSSLNLQPVDTPSLQYDEIAEELRRRFENRLNVDDRAILISHLTDQKHNYQLLEDYEWCITAENFLTLNHTLLNEWRRECLKKHDPSGTKRVSKLIDFLKRWLIVLNPLKPLYQQIRKLIEGPVAVVKPYLKRLFGGQGQ